MVVITKADGTREPFDPAKLLRSLKRSGASDELAQHIENDIEKRVSENMPTREIYAMAFEHLRSTKEKVVARYSLKRAVLDFGPSGFPFESYLAEIFKHEGYSVVIDRIIQGSCVEHEVDAVLTKGDETMYVEAKFHNDTGLKTDLKTALYVKARLDDIASARKAKNIEGTMRGLLVTNTKFTDKALEYSMCAGVELLSWDYPHGRTLHDRIDSAGLYPVTALTTLSKPEKMALLNARIVLCNTIGAESEALTRAGVPNEKRASVLAEAATLCVPGNDI